MMKDFANLYTALEQITIPELKEEALEKYFQQTDDADKLWTIALLTSRKPKRTVKTSVLKLWAAEYANIPGWLFDESYQIVGDLSETISLVIPPPTSHISEGLSYWINYIIALQGLTEYEKKLGIFQAWDQLDPTERLIFNKLTTGGFRMPIPQKMLTTSLAKVTGQTVNNVADRLIGKWSPDEISFKELFSKKRKTDHLSKPFPFFLRFTDINIPENLGSPQEWFAERKWDGIRGQLIKRSGHIFLWSQEDELVTNKFPEIEKDAALLPNGVVLDGEILAFKDGIPLSYDFLHKRISRNLISRKLLLELPVVFCAFDLLEFDEKDQRSFPYEQRRLILETILKQQKDSCIIESELIEFTDWEYLRRIQEASRENYCEGLMLKNRYSTYLAGRKKEAWWKWRIDPMTVDAVIIYAQRGQKLGSNSYTEYTFGVRHGEQLIPFAKTNLGLTEKDAEEINLFIRKNTLERFGPVRVVKPELVFEIAFQGIQKSKRHKSGIALRFPRIIKWKKDKSREQVNTLEDLQLLLEKYG